MICTKCEAQVDDNAKFCSICGAEIAPKATPRSLLSVDLNESAELLNSGQLDEAQALLERLIKAYPNNAIVNNNLGALFMKRGRAKEARAYYERAIRLEPSLAVARDNLRGIKIRTFFKKPYVWAGALLVLGFVAGALSHLSQPNPETMFFNFVPQNEVGAPRNMRQLVETYAGDAGYANSSYYPGTIDVINNNDGSYLIDWTVNGIDYEFKLSHDGRTLSGANAYGLILLDTTTQP